MPRPEPFQESQQSREIQGKYDKVKDRVAKAFDESAVTVDGEARKDFALVKVYGEDKSTTDIRNAILADNAEMNDLQDELKGFRDADAVAQALEQKQSIMHPMDGGGGDPGGNAGGWNPGAGGQKQFKAIGQQLIEHADWQKMRKQKGFELKFADIGLADLIVGTKTLFERTAGWAPESVRSGVVVPGVTRPLQVMDIMPTGGISQAVAKYMEETTRTHAAAEKDEGAAYAESTFALTERTQTVEKITDSVPVTDEQLEDEAMAQSYLNERIGFGVRQRLDLQIIQGDGSTPNLQGILDKGGIQTQAKGSDPVPDAFFKLMTKLRVTGRVVPTHSLMHPNDWQGIRLLRTTDGIYIWGNPSEAGPERLWGLPVVQADSLDENTGIVGSFEGSWIQLLERRGLSVEMGFVNDDFTKGKQTIRASMRVVIVIYRAAAFGTVTSI